MNAQVQKIKVQFFNGSRPCSQDAAKVPSIRFHMAKISRRQEMRFCKSTKFFALLATVALLLSSVVLLAQETTGGLQGTVKDASGA